MQPVKNIDSLGFVELLNDFDNRIVFCREELWMNQLNDKTDSTLMIDSLFLNKFSPFYSDAYLQLNICFIEAEVEYRIPNYYGIWSYLCFDFNKQTIYVDHIDLVSRRGFKVKLLTGLKIK
ncbi:MAG: hypothetical protein ABI207_02855 [Crocinitomicaceae bacterium]